MASDPQPSVEDRPRKRRRHGYRGYGSPISRNGETYGGAVHWGRGFAGLGFAGEGGGALPFSDHLIPQDLRENVSRPDWPPPTERQPRAKKP
jgi:hypothetical protein